jgi:hypothetical protein
MSSVMDWLLEEDAANPGVRYFTLTDLLGHPAGDPQVRAARQAVMQHGPVPDVLAAQDPAGFWQKPGPGYNPKYRSTVWSVIYLAQLGADPAEPAVRAGGAYLLDHAIAANGIFSVTATPSGCIHCLAGNLAAALLDLGFRDDERLQRVLEQLSFYVTGKEIAPAEEKDKDGVFVQGQDLG